MSDLVPAAELAKKRPRITGESPEYTTARDKLMTEEIEFRRHETRLAQLRKALPPGPVVEKNYRFKDTNGADAGLLDLFGKHNTLVTYFWMYGPQRERPCPMCTSTVGALNASARDIMQRTALKIVGRSTVERQLAFARERGWQNLDFVQTAGDDYAKDFHLLNADGSENPALVVYQRDGEKVRIFWSAEQTKEMADPGQDPRLSPDIPALWAVLDLTPEGRGTTWYPKLYY